MALEFALISIPFLMSSLFVLELSYDLFTQEALDAALRTASRQLETGNAQNAVNGDDFLTKYLCPDMRGLLGCQLNGTAVGNVLINVQAVSIGTDLYDLNPKGTIPTSGGALDPTLFQGSTSFCNAGPRQFVQLTVIYVGPTFIGYLLPTIMSLKYQGQVVHATLSATAFAAEQFPPAPSPGGNNPTPASICPITTPTKSS